MFKHSRQPNFEHLRTALLNGQPGAVPLIELGIHPSIKESILNRPVRSIEDDIEFMGSMCYDFVKIQPHIQFDLNRTTLGGNTDDQEFGYAPDRAWSSEHAGIITNWEEFEQFDWPRTEDIDYSDFEKARALLPEGMGIIGQYGDIFTTVWETMGLETFALSIYENPDLVGAIFERVCSLITHMFDSMAGMDWVEALWYSDDIAYSAGLIVSPDILRTYFFPSLQHIGQLARGRGIPLIYHSDGVLWDVMEDIIASGVSALHPVEPSSMDIMEVKERVGDRLCLCGSIDLDLLARGDTEEVRRLVKKRLNDIAPGGGFCIGSSNSVPEYVKVDNYLAMVEASLEYGGYD
jgi:uroporphyrinogen decarboxylase